MIYKISLAFIILDRVLWLKGLVNILKILSHLTLMKKIANNSQISTTIITNEF